MATVSIATFVQHVRMKMDEMMSDGAVSNVGGEDNYAIDGMATALVQECVDEVVLKAPLSRLSVSQSSISAATAISFSGATLLSGATAARKAVVCEIPLSCFRFVSIEGGPLKRPIIQLTPADSPEAKAQGNIYTMGRESHPVAVSDGKTVWIYSFLADATLSGLLLNSVQRVMTTNGISDSALQPQLISAAEWICAAKIFDSQGDAARSKCCADNAQSLING